MTDTLMRKQHGSLLFTLQRALKVNNNMLHPFLSRGNGGGGSSEHLKIRVKRRSRRRGSALFIFTDISHSFPLGTHSCSSAENSSRISHSEVKYIGIDTRSFFPFVCSTCTYVIPFVVDLQERVPGRARVREDSCCML